MNTTRHRVQVLYTVHWSLALVRGSGILANLLTKSCRINRGMSQSSGTPDCHYIMGVSLYRTTCTGTRLLVEWMIVDLCWSRHVTLARVRSTSTECCPISRSSTKLLRKYGNPTVPLYIHVVEDFSILFELRSATVYSKFLYNIYITYSIYICNGSRICHLPSTHVSNCWRPSHLFMVLFTPSGPLFLGLVHALEFNLLSQKQCWSLLDDITLSSLSNAVLVRHETVVDIVSCYYRHVSVHGVLDPCFSVKRLSRAVRLFGQVARAIS